MDITAFATKRMEWMATLSEEDKAKVLADRAAFSAEETKAERMAEVAETFGAADTNQDGRLDRAEFEDFISKIGQNLQARNVPFHPQDQFSAEEKDGVYAIFNSKSAEDGITMQEFSATMKDIQAKIAELMGQ